VKFTIAGTSDVVTDLTETYTYSNTGGDLDAAPSDAGSYTLTVSADGGTDYVINEQTIPFTISKAAQTITFAAPTISKVGETASLSASASSGLAVTYASGDTGKATITGGSLKLLAAGTVTITASQAGNDNYNAAADVTHSITISTTTSSTPSTPGSSSSGGVSIGGGSSSSVVKPVKVTLADGSEITVQPSKQKLTLNGKSVSVFAAYNIDGNNFFKLSRYSKIVG
jgi:hypothetical protein